MATVKRNKIQTEIDKARERLMEQQARLRELESKKTEAENMEIVDIVRGLNIPLDDLAVILQSLKDGGVPAAPSTSGQVDPKSVKPTIIVSKNDDTDKEDNEE